MGWISIVTLLVQIFGPLIADWLKRRMEDRLKKAASSMPAMVSFGSAGDGVAALFDRALADTPLILVGERRMLKAARKAALARAEEVWAAASGESPAAAFAPLSDVERGEIAEAAAAADGP